MVLALLAVNAGVAQHEFSVRELTHYAEHVERLEDERVAGAVQHAASGVEQRQHVAAVFHRVELRRDDLTRQGQPVALLTRHAQRVVVEHQRRGAQLARDTRGGRALPALLHGERRLCLAEIVTHRRGPSSS